MNINKRKIRSLYLNSKSKLKNLINDTIEIVYTTIIVIITLKLIVMFV